MATIDKSHCSGCRDNFYNGNNNLGVNECWLLQNAKLMQRFRIHRDSPMGIKANYEEVEKPNCYHQEGYVFLNFIPDHAK